MTGRVPAAPKVVTPLGHPAAGLGNPITDPSLKYRRASFGVPAAWAMVISCRQRRPDLPTQN